MMQRRYSILGVFGLIVAIMSLQACVPSTEDLHTALMPNGNGNGDQRDRPEPRPPRQAPPPPANQSTPQRDRSPSARTDPGAEALVSAMRSAMNGRIRGADGRTHIGLRHLRNQSHATSREFEQFRTRLADLLTRSGRSRGLLFVVTSEPPPQYELHGSAYLITADGFDQWELYLSLMPAGESWLVWDPGAPARMLRQPRPGAPQIQYPATLER